MSVSSSPPGAATSAVCGEKLGSRKCSNRAPSPAYPATTDTHRTRRDTNPGARKKEPAAPYTPDTTNKEKPAHHPPRHLPSDSCTLSPPPPTAQALARCPTADPPSNRKGGAHPRERSR